MNTELQFEKVFFRGFKGYDVLDLLVAKRVVNGYLKEHNVSYSEAIVTLLKEESDFRVKIELDRDDELFSHSCKEKNVYFALGRTITEIVKEIK